MNNEEDLKQKPDALSWWFVFTS